MRMNKIIGILPKLLNIPDIVIIVFLLVNCIFGFKQGFLRSVYGLLGKAAALIGSVIAARAAAPFIAERFIMPVIGEAFDKQFEGAGYHELLEGLRESVEEAAQNLAESIAYILLLTIFGVLFGFIVSLIYKGLKSMTKLGPVNLLDSIGGMAIGLAAGVVIVALVLLCIEWFSPITYSELGWLSPERVADSVLLKIFIDMLPVAI